MLVMGSLAGQPLLLKKKESRRGWPARLGDGRYRVPHQHAGQHARPRMVLLISTQYPYY